MSESPQTARVCVGVIAGVHGVRGLIKVKPFTEDPAAVVAYGPVTDEAGRRRFALELMSFAKGQWLARIDGVADRNAAEALRGARLYVERAALPAPEEDEFYHADLIGLRAELPDGTLFGRVKTVFDFGAGDVVEIGRPDGSGVMVPFTRAAVPVVDLPGGRIVVDPPAGLMEPPDHRPEDERGEA
jgi:16S rRNA processing protein RimM